MSTATTEWPRKVSPKIKARRLATAEGWVPMPEAEGFTPAAMSVLSAIAKKARQYGRCDMTWVDLCGEAQVSESVARNTVAKAEQQRLLKAEGRPLNGIVITSQRWLLHARKLVVQGPPNRAARRAAAARGG